MIVVITRNTKTLRNTRGESGAIMAQFTTTDLSTGKYRERLAKNVLELIGRRTAVSLADNKLLSSLTSFVGDIAPELRAVAGVAGGAWIQSPAGFSKWLGPILGVDPLKLNDGLNEGLDELVTTFIDHVNTKRKQDENYAPTDADVDAALQAYLQKPDNKLKLLIEHPVVIDVKRHEFHDVQCPLCWKSTFKQGKKGAPTTTQTQYQEGCKEVPLEWALRNGYAPTTSTCCGKTAHETVTTFLQAPKSLMTVLAGLNPELQQRFFQLRQDATEEDRARIIAAQSQVIEPAVLQMMLTNAQTAALFAGNFPKSSAVSNLKKTVVDAFKGLVTEGPNHPAVKSVRKQVDGVTSHLREESKKADLQQRVLDKILKRF